MFYCYLQSVIQSKQEMPQLDADPSSLDDSMSDVLTEPRSIGTRMSSFEEVVHGDFRLWVTTRADTNCLIPGLALQCLCFAMDLAHHRVFYPLGVLVQYGVKVSCEMVHNFQDTLSRTYDNVFRMLQKLDTRSLAVLSPTKVQ